MCDVSTHQRTIRVRKSRKLDENENSIESPQIALDERKVKFMRAETTIDVFFVINKWPRLMTFLSFRQDLLRNIFLKKFCEYLIALYDYKKTMIDSKSQNKLEIYGQLALHSRSRL